jgi:nucleoside diphosphate kinase
MEQSVYIIRPEGMCHREEIRAMIEADGLRIVEIKLLVFPADKLPILYDDMNEEFWIHFQPVMCEGFSEIGIVEGEEAARRLKELAGLSPNPDKCAPHTIRKKFGKSGAHFLFPSGNPCFFNPIHAPHEDEVKKDLALARELMASCE